MTAPVPTVRPRWLAPLVVLGLLLSLLWLLTPGQAAPGPGAQLLDHAQRFTPPDSNAIEQALPLHWDITAPGQQATTELRLRFDFPATNASPAEPWSLLIPRLGNAWAIELNGQALASAGRLDQPGDAWAAKRPVWLTLPTVLLQPQNELRIRLRMDTGRRAGLSRLWVGPTASLLPMRDREDWLRSSLPQAASVLSLVVATLCILLWLQQHDPLYAWAALGELAWALRVADSWWEASPLGWPAWGLFVLGLIWIWSGALYQFIAALQFSPRPRWERNTIYVSLLGGPLAYGVSWALHTLRGRDEMAQHLGPLAYGLGSGQQTPMFLVVWMLGTLLFWAVLNVRLAREVWRKPDLSRALVVIALALSLMAIGRDIYAGRASALHYEESAWAKYAAVTLALSVLVIVSLRFQQARDELLRLNSSIGQKLAQREAELTEQHVQVTALERDRAAAEERTRILRDMHDGAGAHLIAAIHQVESGQATRQELLQTLRESLDQLRLNIDAMHLPPGDINALLSSLRYRLERRIQAAGLRLVWRADELPLIAHFQSQQLRHVQFIVLEAISNAIQHAQGSRLTISATADPTHVVLEIRDDGVGAGAGAGNGLRSMRERAALIGAALEHLNDAPGTCVVLRLPLQPPV
ncbi:sensor histidine kinase [Hydrogenophaga sp. RWCD_12]|uniref:sensor histidine kinase n=1 Tax=Hydrogenophaga sp. RWCD_12 TaxID=3391190 RepID=UPI00398509E2